MGKGRNVESRKGRVLKWKDGRNGREIAGNKGCGERGRSPCGTNRLSRWRSDRGKELSEYGEERGHCLPFCHW